MTRYTIILSQEARAQLVEIYRYIATEASPQTAARYTDAIVAHCESFATFPHRGSSRDDVRPGLRITHYRRRVVIAFDIEDRRVNIIGVYYGGPNFEDALKRLR